MKKVLFIYRFLPQYRVDFFHELRNALHDYNIDLQLIYGKSRNSDALKMDEVDIEWATFVPNRTFRLGKTELIWQPCLRFIRDADLVIVQPENKLLLNYCLMFARYFSKFKLGFWGHGRNMQSNPRSLRNRFKYLFINKCDWWFAYTKGIRQLVSRKHFAEAKITVVQNAIDTVTLNRQYDSVSEDEVNDLRSELGVFSNHTAIYCGGMYDKKRIDFILEACQRVKAAVPDFHMIFLGRGIDSHKIVEASKTEKWIHYPGAKFGEDRIKYFKLATLQLMPSAVGLGVVDSFAMETPLITTNNPYHGPEIEYLENGVNGIITNDNLDDYSRAIVDTFQTGCYANLLTGCRFASKKYTLENMVENFKNGILASLKYQATTTVELL